VSELKKSLIALLATTIIISSAIIAYQYTEDIHIGTLIFGKKDRVKSSGIYARLILSASIDDKILQLQFLIPCRDIKQRDEVLGKLPVIQNEILMRLSHPEVARVVEQRRFSTIKRYVLQAINIHSSESIHTLYLESYFFN
jgi:hypothetical protein